MTTPEELKRREAIKERLRAKGAPISPTGTKKWKPKPAVKPGEVEDTASGSFMEEGYDLRSPY